MSNTDLDQKYIGSLCVDTASLMICDPWYMKMRDEIEKEECKVQSYMYRVFKTGELFCADDEADNFPSELLGYDEAPSIKEMLSMGIIEKVDYDGKIPEGKLQESDRVVDHVVFASSSGGTQAGLVVGGSPAGDRACPGMACP